MVEIWDFLHQLRSKKKKSIIKFTLTKNMKIFFDTLTKWLRGYIFSRGKFINRFSWFNNYMFPEHRCTFHQISSKYRRNIYVYTVGLPHLQIPHPRIQPTMEWKYFKNLKIDACICTGQIQIFFLSLLPQ